MLLAACGEQASEAIRDTPWVTASCLDSVMTAHVTPIPGRFSVRIGGARDMWYYRRDWSEVLPAWIVL